MIMTLNVFLTLLIVTTSLVSNVSSLNSLLKTRSRQITTHCTTKSTPSTTVTSLSKPKWAGAGQEDTVSKFVNALIGFKPLFNVMKIAARKTLIGTAEKNGIPWRARAEALEQSFPIRFQSTYNDIINSKKDIVYPSYYTQEFHAYDLGNLNWQAAVECESATMSMALRVWPKEGLTAEEAQDKLRNSFLDAVENYYYQRGSESNDSKKNAFEDFINTAAKKKISAPKKIIDVGCSVGVSTFYLAERFNTPATRSVDALDLSPHFLSVAEDRKRQVLAGDTSIDQRLIEKFSGAGLNRINFIFGNAEDTRLPASSYDITAVSFMFHELPQEPSESILSELYRITSKNGVAAITDNNPRSSVIQNLPPALFTLMKSTEPWSDEYYEFDLEASMRKVGFTDVVTIATDPRHRTVLGRKI